MIIRSNAPLSKVVHIPILYKANRYDTRLEFITRLRKQARRLMLVTNDVVRLQDEDALTVFHDFLQVHELNAGVTGFTNRIGARERKRVIPKNFLSYILLYVHDARNNLPID